MSYQEKRTIVMMITSALVLGAYCIYAFGQVQAGAVIPGDLKFWARTVLVFIGIGIAATIVLQIIFHILMSIGITVGKKIRNEDLADEEINKSIQAEMIEDEMDKLIELKSNQISIMVSGFGFVAALIAVLLGNSAVMLINMVFISFSLGMIIEGFAKLYYYRRGIRHA
ncbi:MAG: hypothetical protein CVU46_00890 [Chloroflexi bacterium HGW-Chloroflexi-8]|jgi:hypothetical protein|nr:MAG: hypothetical protein CVU46_00890 [Chloroflexi bacterium HGW-Chloroflexi-8]